MLGILSGGDDNFDDLPSLMTMSTVEEAESEDSGKDSPVSLAEVAELVKKLFNAKAQGGDEIRPEMQKAFGVVGVSWLTHASSVSHGG